MQGDHHGRIPPPANFFLFQAVFNKNLVKYGVGNPSVWEILDPPLVWVIIYTCMSKINELDENLKRLNHKQQKYTHLKNTKIPQLLQNN